MAGHGHEVALIQQWIEHGLQFINLQIPRIHGGDEMLFPSPGMQEVVDPDPDACCVFLESVSLSEVAYIFLPVLWFFLLYLESRSCV